MPHKTIIDANQVAENQLVIRDASVDGVNELDVVYYDGSNYVSAIATGLSSGVSLGIANNVSGGTADISTAGLTSGFTGLSAGSVYYLSENSAGQITDTPPAIRVPVGVAVSTTEIMLIPGGWTTLYGFKPSNCVIVAASGGDYTSIKSALDYVSTQSPSASNPWAVFIYPDIYSEDAMTVPDYTNVIAASSTGSAIITPSSSTDTVFTCGNYSEISGVFVRNASGAGGRAFYVNDKFQSLIRNCIVANCETGMEITGSGANAVVTDMIFSRTSGTVLNTSIDINGGATAIIISTSMFGTATSLIGTGVSIAGSDTSATIDALSVAYATTGMKCDTGSFTVITASGLNNCGTGIETDGTDSILQASTTNIRFASTYDILLNDSSLTGYFFGAASLSNSDFNGATKFFIQIIRFAPGREGLQIVADLKVGSRFMPSTSSFGEGGPDIEKQHVFTNTNGTTGTWADITTAAVNPVGSTFTLFPGTGAENCFYIGVENHVFSGIVLNDITTAMVLGTGAVAIEYWNGSSWTSIHVIETDAEYPHESNANVILQETGSFNIRFETIVGWTISTLNGQSAYWMRIRITSAITTAPVAQWCQHHSNSTQIEHIGFVEYFGTARQLRTIPLGNLLNIDGFEAANFPLNINANTSIIQSYSKRQNSRKDGSGGLLRIPEGLDTSLELIFKVFWAVDGTNTGNVENELYIAKISSGDTLDGTIPEIHYNDITTVTLANNDHVIIETDFSPLFNTAVPGDTYAWSLIRDATITNPDDTLNQDTYIVNVVLEGYFWH